MALWYYGKEGGQLGPVEEGELRAMLAAGTVGPTTLVWTDGMTDWRPLAQVPQWSGQVAIPAYGPMSVAPTNGTAIAAMVCGILSIVLLVTCWMGIVTAIPAVVCGHLSLGQIQRSPVPQAGRGMAVTGLILGYLTLLVGLIGVIFFGAMIFTAAQQA